MKAVLGKKIYFSLNKVKNLASFVSFVILLSISAYFFNLIEQNIASKSQNEVHNLCEDIPLESEVEFEFEKIEVIPHTFITLPVLVWPQEEESIKNPIPSLGILCLVYLDVISPPPWNAAVFS